MTFQSHRYRQQQPPPSIFDTLVDMWLLDSAKAEQVCQCAFVSMCCVSISVCPHSLPEIVKFPKGSRISRANISQQTKEIRKKKKRTDEKSMIHIQSSLIWLSVLSCSQLDYLIDNRKSVKIVVRKVVVLLFVRTNLKLIASWVPLTSQALKDGLRSVGSTASRPVRW